MLTLIIYQYKKYPLMWRIFLLTVLSIKCYDEIERVHMIILTMLISFSVIVGAISIVVTLVSKKIKSNKELFENIKSKNGVNFEIIVKNDNYFLTKSGPFFFCDRQTKTFGVDLSGKIYKAKDVVSYKIINSLSTQKGSVSTQEIVIYFLKDDGQKNYLPKIDYEKNLEISYPSEWAYSTLSKKYQERRQVLNKIIMELNHLTRSNIDDFYLQNNFVPTEEFSDNYQLFAYDKNIKKVITKDATGFCVIYDMQDIIRYEIREETEKYSSMATSGVLFSLGEGSAVILNEKTAKVCKSLRLLLFVDGRTDEVTCDEFVFIQDYEALVDSDYYLQQKEKMQHLINMIEYVKTNMKIF